MLNINGKITIFCGTDYGDEGKGKAVASYIKKFRPDLTIRYNGGPNAGHSVIKENGAHYKLHQIPSGVAYQEMGLIGPGCVLDIKKLYKEVEEFKKVEGFDPLDYLLIHPQVSLIESKHLDFDSKYHAKEQGSTSSGIAPAYSDYYNRVAKLAKESVLKTHVLKDMYQVQDVLLEGAQGFYLNPHSGNYPYTTSSSCHPGAAAMSLQFDVSRIKDIIGVAKCYSTRSGFDPTFMNLFENGKFLNEKITFDSQDITNFNTLQEFGKEFGVTTGRKRAVRYLCLERLINSVKSMGCNIVLINKWDILETTKIYKLIVKNRILTFKNSISMFNFIDNTLKHFCPKIKTVIYSDTPYSNIPWEDYI